MFVCCSEKMLPVQVFNWRCIVRSLWPADGNWWNSNVFSWSLFTLICIYNRKCFSSHSFQCLLVPAWAHRFHALNSLHMHNTHAICVVCGWFGYLFVCHIWFLFVGATEQTGQTMNITKQKWAVNNSCIVFFCVSFLGEQLNIKDVHLSSHSIDLLI